MGFFSRTHISHQQRPCRQRRAEENHRVFFVGPGCSGSCARTARASQAREPDSLHGLSAEPSSPLPPSRFTFLLRYRTGPDPCPGVRRRAAHPCGNGKFFRSVHGSNACVRLVTWTVTPGLDRSTESAAQWIIRRFEPHPSLALRAAPSGVRRRCTASCTAARKVNSRSLHYNARSTARNSYSARPPPGLCGLHAKNSH
jgi:hypothetical protein